MIQSRNWTAIERLPETPGVVKMTGNGFWLDGKFYPAHRQHVPAPVQPRRGLLARVMGW